MVRARRGGGGRLSLGGAVFAGLSRYRADGAGRHSALCAPALIGGLVRYTAVIERGPTSYSAYVPDLPGCIAAAETRDEACELIREAAAIYVEELERTGQPVPSPQAYEPPSYELVEVSL